MSAHEYLLNDKFVEFSSAVAALHEKKKEMVAEFKRLHDKFKEDVKAIENEVLDLHAGFEQWKDELLASKAKAQPKQA